VVEPQLPYSELVTKILGPPGTPIALRFRRGSDEGEVVDATITRATLNAQAQVAVRRGLERETAQMREIVRQNQAFLAQKAAMNAEIAALREKVQQCVPAATPSPRAAVCIFSRKTISAERLTRRTTPALPSPS